MTLLDIIFWVIDFSRRVEIASMQGRHDEPLLKSGRHFYFGAQQLSRMCNTYNNGLIAQL
jgi:hypothetical protein